MMEKGNINIFVSCVSLIVSVLAVCIAAYRTPALSFDYQGVLVGTLSLLVTVLIGWQVINYFMVEKRTRSYAKKLVEKYSHSVNCYAVALTAVTAYERNVTEAGIDVSISAIKEGLKGYDMTALALPMSHLLHLAKDCKARKYEARIRKGKRMEYIKVLSNVKDPDADIVVDMLMRANEA